MNKLRGTDVRVAREGAESDVRRPERPWCPAGLRSGWALARTLAPPQRGGASLGITPSLVPHRPWRGTPCPLGRSDVGLDPPLPAGGTSDGLRSSDGAARWDAPSVPTERIPRQDPHVSIEVYQ